MKARVVSSRWLGVIAIAIALSFVGGLFANSVFLGGGNSKNTFAVGDSYRYGECVGTCPEHGFTFGMDIVTVTVSHQGQAVFLANYPNIITHAGEDLISRQTACGAIGAPACADGGVYIALSTNATIPASTDTTCPSELTSNGLARTLGTYSHATGAITHVIKASFIYSTSVSPTTITKVCMFDATSGGNLFAESLLSPSATVSAVGDNVTIQWTFTH
jgi:NAD-dependent dihydropyrimidine dehydrogenase PreA subunit